MRISKIISSILTLIAALGISTNLQAELITKSYQFVAGDVLIQKETMWKALKVLDVDKIEGKQVALHVLVFEETKKKPSLNSLNEAKIEIYHAPVAADSFDESWELLGNKGISKSDLIGFTEYLKKTNFQRYAEITNQNADELILLANSKYKEGYSLSKKTKFNEALALYLEAVDIFPMFIEATDQIALTYMFMGDNENAIKFFDKSLSIDPNSIKALYYKGRCYINLGDHDSAIEIFKDGMSRFPEEKSAFEEVYLELKNIRSNG